MATGSTLPLFTARFAVHRVWLFLLLLALPLPAQTADDQDPLPAAQASLERLESTFAASQDNTTSIRKLLALKEDNATVTATALDCAKQAEPELARLNSELAILAPTVPAAAPSKSASASPGTTSPAAPLAPAIAKQLNDVQTQKTSLEGRITACKLLLLRSNRLNSNLTDYLHGLEARQLLIRGPSLIDVLQENLDAGDQWLALGSQLANPTSGWSAARLVKLSGAATAGLLCFLLGLFLPRHLRKLTPKFTEKNVSTGLVQAVIASAVSYAPIVLALTGVTLYAQFFTSADTELPVLVSLLYALLAFFVLSAGIRALLNPCPPATRYLSLPETIAIPLSRHSHVLAMVLMLRWVAQQLHAENLLDDSMYTLTRHLVSVAWVLNVVWALWLLRRLDGWRDKWALIGVVCLALFGGLVALWIGYINLGTLVISGVTFTLLLVGLTLVTIQLFSDLFDGLDAGRYHWQQALRKSIGLKTGDYVPGLGWLRLVVNLMLLLTASQLLLLVWDANESITGDLLRYFTQGFQVAGVTIVPAQLLWAILIFVMLLALTGWLKGRLNSVWLVKTHMEPSARDALVTTFGYVSIGVAIIVALSVAGINLASLAIIAGALSVGIGFGLQNIVNNFVSGIIMLVERPVRNGDWIVVGNTEGYVQRINIRTTTIRTFDRADVIVPNSDLISGQVINWTLGNTLGRAKVKIGVAYGCDVETVMATLLEVAKKHPAVITGNSHIPDPYVLFLDFGDSSLDFELRAIIRDVNYLLNVVSDLNRAINAEFNRLGIEIPFPQSDVHFRNPLQVQGNSDKTAETHERANAPQEPKNTGAQGPLDMPDASDND